MPKITTKKFEIAGQLREFGVFYSETDKFFIKDFDDRIGGKYTSKKYGAGSKTFEELIEKAQTAITKYEEEIAELRKVIVLELTASGSHLERYRNEDRSWKAPKYIPEWLNDIYSSNVYDGQVMGFHIEYEVKMFRSAGDKHQFFDITEKGELINEQTIENTTKHQIIDWTQEREDALKKLHDMFEVLLHKFVAAMKNPEQFIEAINQQKLLA